MSDKTVLEKRADRLHARLDRLRDDVNDLARDIEADKNKPVIMMPGMDES